MSKLLVIGLDGAEPLLLERWMADDTLPNLKRLRERGGYGYLDSDAGLLAGSVWFSFYTGQTAANHGIYNYLVWRPEKMTTEPPSAKWLDLQPFWRTFGQNGPRAVVVDIPLTYAPTAFNGSEVIGWATHDSLEPLTSFPPELADRIRARFGDSMQEEERYGLLNKREFLAIRDQMVWITQNLRDLCLSLMQEESWDLFMVCFATIHRGGHKLWDLTNVTDKLTSTEKAELQDSLRQLYIACDEAVGKMVEQAGPDATILIFSPKGMGQNACRNSILPEMLHRVLAGEYSQLGSIPETTPLSRMRNLIPSRWRHRVKSRLPIRWRQLLTGFWRVGQINWEHTPAFSMMADVQGWIRINLKGREAKGIVEPGREYEALCQQIVQGLKTFVDADSGQPLVKEIIYSRDVYSGRRLDWLPDLILNWVDTPAHEMRAAYSPLYGTIPWPTPGRNPEGRSGNHGAIGMLLVSGKGIEPGPLAEVDILDLAPTILSLLGQPLPETLDGQPIDEILYPRNPKTPS
jgi:predicted AlkP superfamily phosphohydrolase/phosphomutase